MSGVVPARLLNFTPPLFLFVVQQAVLGQVPLASKFSKQSTRPDTTHERVNVFFSGLANFHSEIENPGYAAWETLGEVIVGQVVGAREIFEIVGQFVATDLRDEVALLKDTVWVWCQGRSGRILLRPVFGPTSQPDRFVKKVWGRSCRCKWWKWCAPPFVRWMCRPAHSPKVRPVLCWSNRYMCGK
jgi:hypothetical protein